MSKFNTIAPTNTSLGNVKTTNHEGGEAFTLDNSTALYINASTSLGGGSGDKFYTTANEDYKNIVSLVHKVAKKDPEFIFSLAAYCRKELYLRSIPSILFIEGIRAMHSNKPKGSTYPIDVTNFAYQVFGRPDEITEAIAYWLHVNKGNHTLPMNLRKSLEIAFNKFSEYSLVKYNQENKSVKLKDVLRLVHPTPKNETQGALFNYIIRGVEDSSVVVTNEFRKPVSNEEFERLLPMTAAREKLLKLKEFNSEAKELITTSNATWETVVSKFGSTKEVWEYLIPNMGYMATLRNLNNFLKHDVPIKDIVEKLTSKEEVLNSKQLPFRFLSAMKAIDSDVDSYYNYNDNGNLFGKWSETNGQGDTKVVLRSALGKALNLSIENIPKFEGRTLSVADVSGSMGQLLNSKSTVTALEIACLMAAMANKLSTDGISAAFGTTFQTLEKDNKNGKEENILSFSKRIAKLVDKVGMSTNAWTILNYLINNKIVCNRIMYFTDTECYNSYRNSYDSYTSNSNQTLNNLWKQYQQLVSNLTKGEIKPYLYEVNLVGGNTSSFDKNTNIALIGGWSDRIFESMATFESDPRSMVTKIKELYPAKNSKTLAMAKS